MNTSTMTTRQRTTDGTTMQAIIQDRYGEAEDVLRLEEIDRPAIGDGEVLLRVHAAGVDRGVWHLMTGLPYPVRLAGYGVRAPKTPVRGREVAGRVEAVGPAVTTLQVGDEVFGIGDGSFAEYARARADKLAPKPANLTFAQAAAVPVSGAHGPAGGPRPRPRAGRPEGAGHRRVRRRRHLRRADRQGIRRRGHRRVPDGEAGPGPVPRRRPRHRLHAATDIADGGHRYDVILDIGGNRSLTHLRRALDSPRDARHRRRRDRRTLARRQRPSAPGLLLSPRSSARS